MPYMNGINLAKLIKSKCPYSNIIFMTAYSEYAVDAFNVRASGYLLKPVTCEQLEAEIADLRNPIEEDKSKLLHVQCFGNFEVFSEGKPVTFAYRKTKELFAYLIDRRGASCTIEELCSILWEDKPYTEEVRNYLRKLISDLVHSLKSVHAENVFIKRRNCFSVDVSTIDCDYYRMLKGDAKAVNTYRGEYMSQYDWAIFTLGSLDRELEK
jgi:two-component SAPR family response regulator